VPGDFVIAESAEAGIAHRRRDLSARAALATLGADHGFWSGGSSAGNAMPSGKQSSRSLGELKSTGRGAHTEDIDLLPHFVRRGIE